MYTCRTDPRLTDVGSGSGTYPTHDLMRWRRERNLSRTGLAKGTNRLGRERLATPLLEEFIVE